MAGERIPALALYLAGLASPIISAAIERSKRNPKRDLPGLIDQARLDADAGLSGRVLRLILGGEDQIALESFETAARLCNEAIIFALKLCAAASPPRSAVARSRKLTNYSYAYIWKWAADRAMDPDEVRRLKARGGVA